MGRAPLRIVLASATLIAGVVGVVMVLLFVPNGHSGSASKSERDYFLQVEVAGESFRRMQEELSADMRTNVSPDTTLEELQQLAANLIREILPGFDAYLARLRSLDAPKSVEHEHWEYITSMQGARDFLGNTAVADEAGGQTDIEKNVARVRLSAAFVRFGAACNALVRAASNKGVAIYLDC